MSGNIFPKVPKILVADDEKESANVLKEILKANGYDVTVASDGQEAMGHIRRNPRGYDLFVLDIFMPHVSGNEILIAVKSKEETRLTPVIMITGLGDEKDKIAAIDNGCDDFLTKPYSVTELLARVRSLLKMKFANDDLDGAENVIFSLARAIEAKDAYTQGHTERVSQLALSLGELLGLSKDEKDALFKGGILHDIGKIGVPDSILNKPGKLNDAEFEIIKKHPDIGAKICTKLNSIKSAIPVIRSHHEKLDGSGYPDGLKGDALPAVARIMAIVDVYDALTSTRSYRAAMPKERAIQILFKEADEGWWDKEILVEFEGIVNPIT